jgi:hypothetical protein
MRESRCDRYKNWARPTSRGATLDVANTHRGGVANVRQELRTATIVDQQQQRAIQPFAVDHFYIFTKGAVEPKLSWDLSSSSILLGDFYT